ncbi:MAG: BspA family leucine-rich repeat surface protein, partial [Oscillospiraceae bacterium]|nr:BspA family leucine-rich repeat surface protein [Oscillospiraceae bacterium]
YMFSGCAGLAALDLSAFDTSKAANMSYMFSGCAGLAALDLSAFDTSKVTNMSYMFSGCAGLAALDLSAFDTSKVTNMSYMFSGCAGLAALDLSAFDTSSVTNMELMFSGCGSLAALDLSAFDTSNVIYMGGMFSGCGSLVALDVSSFDTSQTVSMGVIQWTRWDENGQMSFEVTGGMFHGCGSLTELDLSGFNTSKTSNMGWMFKDCASLKTIWASASFGTAAVINSAEMFTNCPALVGGAGTAYDSAHTDAEYAHIDSWDMPGYFTMKNAPAPSAAYTISYHAAGGTGAPQEQTKLQGKALTLSPDRPVREGFDFLGWADSPYAEAAQYQPGGSYEADAGITLYALWGRAKNPRLPGTAEKLGYAFGNTAAAFSYPKDGEYIPLSSYQRIFGETRRANEYYNWHTAWKGNCFGMAGTAGLLFENENGVHVPSFAPGKDWAKELVLGNSNGTLTVREFIEAIQVSQYTERVQAALNRNRFDAHDGPGALDALAAQVKSFGETGHEPPIVAMFGPDGSGHAVLAYAAEELDGNTRLRVYDPNYPNDGARYITLKKTGGVYTGWEYSPSARAAWGEDAGGRSHISFVPYGDFYDIWEQSGSGSGTCVTIGMNVDILDAAGHVLASIMDGIAQSFRPDIFQMEFLDAAPEDGGDSPVILWLPADRYTIQNTAADTALALSVTNTDQSAEVKTTASSVVLDVDDAQEMTYIRFPAEDDARSYEVTVNSNLGAEEKEIRFSGTVDGEGGTALYSAGESLSVAGASGATASLTVNSETIPLDGGVLADMADLPAFVSINANGGGGSMGAIAVTGGSFTFPGCGLEAPLGTAFAGWKMDGDETLYQPGDSAALAGDTLLTAQWKETNDAYALRGLQVAGDIVTAQIQKIRETGGTVIAAAYDGDGRLLGAELRAVPALELAETAGVPLLLPAADAATVRVFICDGSMRPLCPALSWER